MSTIYNLEPPTKGKVCLATTLGDIEIELWPKEAPLACRNFVQLCLEGFYLKTAFHRIVPKFMIQAGDETGTGKGGVSVYGSHFKDEFHTRLRFTHRGIVACANQNAPNTNNSQFFITLDRCEDLDKRYTIFGKVVRCLSDVECVEWYGVVVRPETRSSMWSALQRCQQIIATIRWRRYRSRHVRCSGIRSTISFPGHSHRQITPSVSLHACLVRQACARTYKGGGKGGT